MRHLEQRPLIGNRITVPEIAQRLGVGRQLVYAMLERGLIPAIRVGRPWIVTRHSYETWERNCGRVAPLVLQDSHARIE